jgi:SAM-dependent methyltransferase
MVLSARRNGAAGLQSRGRDQMTKCPFCAGQALSQEEQVRENMLGLGTTFAYRRCAACGSLWLPNPPDMAPYYPPDYYSMQNGGAGGRARFAKGRTAVLMRLPKSIAWRLPKKGVSGYVRWLAGEGIRANSRIADVGSGEGKLLRSLARDGFTDVWGFDPFIKGDLDEGPIHLRQASLDGMFDLIMFNHSLEHTADPLQELDTAFSHLNPAGRVLIRVPIAGSWADRTYGPHWVSLDAPRHLSIPSESGMRKLIERARAELCFMHYESYPFQFSGSERYRRGLPLDAPLPVDDQLSAEWVRRTEELDAAGDGDSAGFVLRAARD